MLTHLIPRALQQVMRITSGVTVVKEYVPVATHRGRLTTPFLSQVIYLHLSNIINIYLQIYDTFQMVLTPLVFHYLFLHMPPKQNEIVPVANITLSLSYCT